MAQGDPCTCSDFVPVVGAPPTWMQQMAEAILNLGEPLGTVHIEEGPDGNCYRFLRETHPAEPSIPFPHPGITVTVCAPGKAVAPPLEGGAGSSFSQDSGSQPLPSPPLSGDVTGPGRCKDE
jgi:hypothetical protein